MSVYCADWGSDQCAGGVVGCSGALGGNVCANAFDDAEGTFWDSAPGFPQYIGYKFPAAQRIQKLRILQYAAEYCQNLIIYGSNDTDHDDDWDLKSWTELLEVTDGEAVGWTEHEFANAISYLYIRLRATAGTGHASYWAVYEIELFTCQPPPAELSGTVKEKGVGVARTIRSYIRSTGAFYNEVLSESNGSFSVGAPDDTTEMYVIALDDDAGDQYNALIYDRVKGQMLP